MDDKWITLPNLKGQEGSINSADVEAVLPFYDRVGSSLLGTEKLVEVEGRCYIQLNSGKKYYIDMSLEDVLERVKNPEEYV